MARQANDNQTFEEEVVEALVESMEADVEYLVSQLAPDGRKPFTRVMTKNEELNYLMGLSPDDWQALKAEVAMIGDQKERDRAIAELFDKWATVQLMRYGLGQDGQRVV